MPIELSYAADGEHQHRVYPYEQAVTAMYTLAHRRIPFVATQDGAPISFTDEELTSAFALHGKSLT